MAVWVNLSISVPLWFLNFWSYIGSVTDKKVGSIVGDLEVIEAIVSNLKVEDDDVIDSDGDIDGLNADDQSYFDM